MIDYNINGFPTFLVQTFKPTPKDRRTKLPMSLLKQFPVECGDYLYFQQENNSIIVTKYKPRKDDYLFRVYVEADNRARLKATHLEQLGATFGDYLVFVFFAIGRAVVIVQQQQLESDERRNIVPSPEETETYQTYTEGASTQIVLSAFERNPKARQACIDSHGLNCCVCDFNFEESYGYIGRDFIEVHHLIPISSIGEEHELDPVRDLRPVCPNCHAMIHRQTPPYTIKEVQRFLKTFGS